MYCFQWGRRLLVTVLSMLMALGATGKGGLQTKTIKELNLPFSGPVNPLDVADCCSHKQVGDIKYNLVGYNLDTASKQGCDSGCVYSTKSIPDLEFCFSSGELHSSCSEPPSHLNQPTPPTDPPITLPTAAPAPVDGKWGDWGGWNTCSEPCGGGNRTRGRACVPPAFGGLECQGEATQTETCNTESCPTPQPPLPVDGKWGDWGEWSTCSEPCGEGNKTRGRHCIPPAFGGLECQGEATQTEPCHGQSCPGRWGRSELFHKNYV